jgi:hypothetical protein
MVKSTIILNDEGKRIKVSKIVFYGNDSGFSILSPYHNLSKGSLFKWERNILDNKKGELKSSWENAIRYDANDRVKLSIHSDGFVQFSGENPGKILSGKEPTGEIKGLGIQTSPLNNPINGPTFGLQAWGLNEFKLANKRILKQDVEFYEHDYYYRLANKNNWTGYFSYKNELGEHVLSYMNPAYFYDKKPMVYKILPYFNVKWNYFVALLATRMRMDLVKSHQSGFTLNSPSVINNNIATHMMACYPAWDVNLKKSKSLNYDQS